eukprot:6283837-Amphidinium_carterae.1
MQTWCCQDEPEATHVGGLLMKAEDSDVASSGSEALCCPEYANLLGARVHISHRSRDTCAHVSTPTISDTFHSVVPMSAHSL